MGTNFEVNIVVGFSTCYTELYRLFSYPTVVVNEPGETDPHVGFRGEKLALSELIKRIAAESGCVAHVCSSYDRWSVPLEDDFPDQEVPVVFGLPFEFDAGAESGSYRLECGAGVSLTQLERLHPLLDELAKKLARIGLPMDDRAAGVHTDWSVG